MKKRGLLEEFCKVNGIILNGRGIHKKTWTYEKCHASAIKCSTLQEWWEKDKLAYQAALKYGWMDEFKKFLKSSRPKNWKFEDVLKDVRDRTKYPTRSSWVGSKSYSACLRRPDWLRKIDALWKKEAAPDTKILFEKCKESGDNYKSQAAWKKGDRANWLIAKQNNWLDKIKPVIKTKVIDFDCALLACEQAGGTLKSWRKSIELGGSPRRPYKVAKDNSWLEKIEIILEQKRNSKTKAKRVPKSITYWDNVTNDDLIKMADDINPKYLRDLPANLVSVMYRRGILNQYRESRNIVQCPLRKKTKWTKDAIIELVLERKFKNRFAFQKESKGAYSAAKKRGWLEEIYAIAGLRDKDKPWTKDECINQVIVGKYKNRNEWAKLHWATYNAARLNGWLDDCLPKIQQLHQKPQSPRVQQLKMDLKRLQVRRWKIKDIPDKIEMLIDIELSISKMKAQIEQAQ